MAVCVYYVFVWSFVWVAPFDGLIPVQGVLPTLYRIKKLKSGQGPKGCRAIDRWVLLQQPLPFFITGRFTNLAVFCAEDGALFRLHGVIINMTSFILFLANLQNSLF
jgi:hypothetical protein